ncbi:MAG: hypothetical protein AAF394_14225, partial [Planctomycetota bacterium]
VDGSVNRPNPVKKELWSKHLDLDKVESHLIQQLKRLLLQDSDSSQLDAVSRQVAMYAIPESSLTPFRIRFDYQAPKFEVTEMQVLVEMAGTICKAYDEENANRRQLLELLEKIQNRERITLAQSWIEIAQVKGGLDSRRRPGYSESRYYVAPSPLTNGAMTWPLVKEELDVLGVSEEQMAGMLVYFRCSYFLGLNLEKERMLVDGEIDKLLLTSQFNEFDKDQDHRLSAEEFQSYQPKLRNDWFLVYNVVYDGLGKPLELKQFDADGDQQVSLEEILEFRRAGMARWEKQREERKRRKAEQEKQATAEQQRLSAERSSEQWVERQFAKYDTDGDKKLSVAESHKMLVKPIGADKDDDGFISPQEYLDFRAARDKAAEDNAAQDK